MRVTINDGVDIDAFDNIWYTALSDSKDVETISVFNYLNKIKATTVEIMSIFYLLAVCLILLGAVTIVVGLHSKVINSSSELFALRRIGLSMRQAGLMIISQNIYYPLIAAVIAIVPVYICQTLFIYIQNKICSGEWASSYTGTQPWYLLLPFGYNLFEYNFVLALLVCIFVGVLLIVIGSAPQIMFFKRHRLVELEE